MAAAARHRSFDSMSGILAWLLGMVKAEYPDWEWRGKRALEIGTGQFMTHALGAWVIGFEEVLTVDKYRQLNPALVSAAMAQPILARRWLSPWVEEDDYTRRLDQLAATDYDLTRLEDLGIRYQAPLELSELVGSAAGFDLVFSYTVLEHVPESEIPGFLAAATAPLAPGGVSIHLIDLEDHRDPRGDPFAFLAPQETPWSDVQCGERGNRLRREAWRRHCAALDGFEWCMPYQVVRREVPLPTHIDPRVSHADEADLRTSCLVVMTRRAP